MQLGTLMSLRKKPTSQAASMVLHVTWLPWQKMLWFWCLNLDARICS